MLNPHLVKEVHPLTKAMKMFIHPGPKDKEELKEIDASETLLKYTNPYLVQNPQARKPPIKPKPMTFGPKADLMMDGSAETQEVLDLIQPPRMWTEKGLLYTQVVSPEPAYRADIHRLHQRFKELLIKKRARTSGICPIRYELHRQLFDELIRQVTITCAERGLLLVRIKAELEFTCDVYHIMWKDASAYFDGIVSAQVDRICGEQNAIANHQNDIEKLKLEINQTERDLEMLQEMKADQWKVREANHRARVEAAAETKKQLNLLYQVVTTENCDVLAGLNDFGMEPKDKEEEVEEKTEEEDELSQYKPSRELILLRKYHEGIRRQREKIERIREKQDRTRDKIEASKAYLAELEYTEKPISFKNWLKNRATEDTDIHPHTRDSPSTVIIQGGDEFYIRDTNRWTQIRDKYFPKPEEIDFSGFHISKWNIGLDKKTKRKTTLHFSELEKKS